MSARTSDTVVEIEFGLDAVHIERRAGADPVSYTTREQLGKHYDERKADQKSGTGRSGSVDGED